MKQSIKKTFLAIALMLAVFASAQAQTPYRNDWKYNFFSNWTVSASVVGTKTPDFSNFEFGTGTNIGADLRLSKRIGQCWDLRYIAEVPAFVGKPAEKNFDRYGKLLSGIEFHPVRWVYLFADAGAGLNPSNINTIGLAADAGLGFSVRLGNWTRTYLELGADRCQNVATNQLNDWNSNFFAKLGLAVSLGITEGDRQGIAYLDAQTEKIEILENDNEALRNENSALSESNAKLSESLANSTDTCKKLENDLNECLNSKNSTEESSVEPIQIYFDYNSFKITDLELEKVHKIYSKMDPSKKYTVNGYCSDNGDDMLNKVLSEKRADAVKNALVKLGAKAENIETVGHGKVGGCDNPICQMVEITRK